MKKLLTQIRILEENQLLIIKLGMMSISGDETSMKTNSRYGRNNQSQSPCIRDVSDTMISPEPAPAGD